MTEMCALCAGRQNTTDKPRSGKYSTCNTQLNSLGLETSEKKLCGTGDLVKCWQFNILLKSNFFWVVKSSVTF